MKQHKSILAICLLGVMLTAGGCARGTSFVKPGFDFSTVGRVATVVECPNLGPTQSREAADLFAMELLKRGWDVIDRANLDQIVTEGEFQNTSGLNSEVGRQQLAVHNVGALIVANIPQYGDEISMTAKMTDVATGSILWMGEGTARQTGTLATLGGALAGAAVGTAAGYAIDKDTTGAVIGGVVGGAAGGIAGAALSPSDVELFRKVIRKVTKEMPAPVPGG